MNSSFNSGIICTQNDANKNENTMNIDQIRTQKMLDAAQKKFKTLMIMLDVY